MAEVYAPSRRSGAEVLLCVVILIAGIFLGNHGWFSRAPEGVNHSRSVSQAAPFVHKSDGTTHGSMNLAEYELFRLLEAVQARVTSTWQGSWGWAIILLTVGINVLLLPLRIYSMRSGMKMKRIQPEMESIRARYKGLAFTDPRRAEMNAEIAQLQKDNGINVLGGCLPLLLQLPLLFGFFGMLRHAEVLHSAGWFWLHDLAAADPCHVLPIAMLVSQLMVQWYTPSPGVDASQRKMMAFITTIAFGYVSWHYAAGLALYAVTGSVLSLMLQVVVNRSSIATEMQPAH